MDLISFWRGNKVNLPANGTKAGQIFYTLDTYEIFVSQDDLSIKKYTDIIQLELENNRISLLSPISNKFYYVQETNKLWYFDGMEWKDIVASVIDDTLTTSISKTWSIDKIKSENANHTTNSTIHVTQADKDAWNLLNDSAIQITHSLNEKPFVLMVVENSYGHTEYGGLGIDTESQIPCKIEYISENTIRIFTGETFVGSPSVTKVNSRHYTVKYSGEETIFNIYLLSNQVYSQTDINTKTSNLQAQLDAIKTNDFELQSDKAFYFGSKSVEGSWRIIRSGNNLNFERLEGGVWNNKGNFLP